MRWLAVAVLLVACKKTEATPPVPQPITAAPADAAAVVSDASVPLVELLHAIPTTVRVSSRVKNRKILPAHLVDRDLGTAWNSRTDDLEGAWIEITIPAGATISELRMTAGHTGKGPKREDYFAMNPRIQQITVSTVDTDLLIKRLDPELRELQTIALPGPISGAVRIRIDEVVLGSRKRWREISVSELEAWGALPAGVTASPQTPEVIVGESLPDSGDKPIDTEAICTKFMEDANKTYEEQKLAEARHIEECKKSGERTCDVSELSPPRCGVKDLPFAAKPPWETIGVLTIEQSEAHGPKTCQTVVAITEGSFFVGPESPCGPWDGGRLTIAKATIEDVVSGDPPELVIELATQNDKGEALREMIICRVASATVQCTRSFALEGPTWKSRARFTDGTLVVDPASGTPPSDLLGPHVLAFTNDQRRPL